MRNMFSEAQIFNKSIANWDVSNVTDMSEMFCDAYKFNQDINTKVTTFSTRSYISWNVSNVENMSYMFNHATLFNQPINNWNVSNVKEKENMFRCAISFDKKNCCDFDKKNCSRITSRKKKKSKIVKNPKKFTDFVFFKKKKCKRI